MFAVRCLRSVVRCSLVAAVCCWSLFVVGRCVARVLCFVCCLWLLRLLFAVSCSLVIDWRLLVLVVLVAGAGCCFVVCGLSFGVCCLLVANWCLVFVVCCALPADTCLLLVVGVCCCSLLVVCCLLVAHGRALFVVRCSLFARCCALFVLCCL